MLLLLESLFLPGAIYRESRMWSYPLVVENGVMCRFFVTVFPSIVYPNGLQHFSFPLTRKTRVAAHSAGIGGPGKRIGDFSIHTSLRDTHKAKKSAFVWALWGHRALQRQSNAFTTLGTVAKVLVDPLPLAAPGIGDGNLSFLSVHCLKEPLSKACAVSLPPLVPWSLLHASAASDNQSRLFSLSVHTILHNCSHISLRVML